MVPEATDLFQIGPSLVFPNKGFVMRLFYLCVSSVLVVLLGALACNNIVPMGGSDDPPTSDGGLGGDVQPLPEGVFQLPFASGEIHLCTQGVGGSYSHDAASTWCGLDLDSSNSAYEELYAPASGIAYVHYDNSDTGFGYHINIDLGDGTYFVLGHMAEIFLEDASEVVVGMLLGYEGCTGSCTGDHVHFDLHEGDATMMAQHGTSIPTSYYVTDATSGSEYMHLPSDQFVCDLYSGHYYESHLTVNTWHPDGTLLIYPSSGEVFVVDRGQLHWIENEEVFWSYGFDFADAVAISERELWCWEESGQSISEPTEYRSVEDEDGVTWLVYELADNPGRYRQVVPDEVYPEILNSWGVSITTTYAHEDGAAMLSDYPVATGWARLRDGTLVQEIGSSTIYVVHEGYALPIKDWETYLMLGFGDRFVFEVPSGTLGYAVSEIGSCDANVGCIGIETVTGCGGDLSIDFVDDDPVFEDDDDVVDDDDSESSADDDDDSDTTGDDDDTVDLGDDDDIVDDDDDTTELSDDDDSFGDDDIADDDTTEITDDDDDTEPLGDDDDTTEEEVVEPDPDWLLLEIEATLSGAPADYVELSGELLDQHDTPAGGGFWWAALETVYDENTVYWSAYVQNEWSFRYSVEYERYGVTSWSCLAPFPPGTITMTVDARLEGQTITTEAIDNHLGGCELYVPVP